MEKVPVLKSIVEHYSGPDRVTAKKQNEELERVAKSIPESAPPSVTRFANRAVLSLQVCCFIFYFSFLYLLILIYPLLPPTSTESCSVSIMSQIALGRCELCTTGSLGKSFEIVQFGSASSITL